MSLVLLAACGGWPRFSHLPEETGTARRAGGDTGEATPTDFDWTVEGPRDENNDNEPEDVGEAELLSLGAGVLVHGRSLGSGWDFTDVPVRQTCGDLVSGFPPDDVGSYKGDVDWRVVRLAADGTFCTSLAYHDDDVRGDMLGYDLISCTADGTLLPSGPWTDDTQGIPLGFAPAGPAHTWSASLAAGSEFALVVSAFSPDDTTRTLVYDWGVALVGPGQVCPEVARP
jgi:hypothetical protein